MSQAVLEERVGLLEREQARQGEQLGQVRSEVSKVAAGVDKLLDREARRPDAMTGKTVAATLLTTGAVISMLGGFTWWLIAQSPAVTNLERRVTRLDDPEIGVVPQLKRRVDTLSGWAPVVKK